MRVLIFTSSGGTAHDAAAYALKAWLQRWDPKGEVRVSMCWKMQAFLPVQELLSTTGFNAMVPGCIRSIGVLWSGLGLVVMMALALERFWLLDAEASIS